MTTVESEADRKSDGPPFRRSSSGSGTRVRPRIGRYEIVGEIASGGMATVYLALRAGAHGPQRFVALKVLHPHLAREPEFVAMFLDEARLASSIRDPHVVPIAEIGRTEDGFFLVMDYVEGDTLARFAARAATRGTRLPRDVVVRVLLDTLAGLHAAHELTDDEGRSLGLVHRDVSPQNILLGTDGFARITDFGVARAAARLSSTRNGRLKGKLAYMAPEQARSESTDRRADVFAAGILLWEMLAGRRLFKAETEAATILRVVVDPIPRLASVAPDVPAPFDAVCAKALSRNPEDRYQTARQMGDALTAAAAEAAAASPLDLGIASPRDVAAYVQEVIGQEIAMQRDVVRAWLEQSEPKEDDTAKARWTTTARLPLHRPLGEVAPKDPADGITATTTVGDEARPAVEAALREIEAAADDAGGTRLGPGTPVAVAESSTGEPAPAKPRLLLQPDEPRAPHPPPVRSLLASPATPVPPPTHTRRGMGPIGPQPARASAPTPQEVPNAAPVDATPPPVAAAPNLEPADDARLHPSEPTATPPPVPARVRAPVQPELPPPPRDRAPMLLAGATIALVCVAALLLWWRAQAPDEPVGTPLPLPEPQAAAPSLPTVTAPEPGPAPSAAASVTASAAAMAAPAPVVEAPVPSTHPSASAPSPASARPTKSGARRSAASSSTASPASPAPGEGGDDLSNPYRR